MSFVLSVAPALPLHTAGKYVAAAYVVFLALVLIYVAIHQGTIFGALTLLTGSI